MMNGVVFLMDVEEMHQAIFSHHGGVRVSLLRPGGSWRELLVLPLVRDPDRLKLTVKFLKEEKLESIDNTATDSTLLVDEDWLFSLQIILHPFVKAFVEFVTLEVVAGINTESITLQNQSELH